MDAFRIPPWTAAVCGPGSSTGTSRRMNCGRGCNRSRMPSSPRTPPTGTSTQSPRRERHKLRLLLIHPGATWSTADVEAGLRYGLEEQGVSVVQYRLDARIERSKRWLHAAWRRAKKGHPAIERPTVADIFYQAGIGALEQALRHQVDVVLVISAMFLHPDVIVLMKRA